MRRRQFFTLVGGAAAAWPLVAHAQQREQMRRIGVLMGYAESDSEGQAFVAAFREELQKLGWAENRNVRIDYRWAGDADSIQRFAKELVALQPELILSNNTPTTAALLQQTRAIPIIFALAGDPIGGGFVATLPLPGGNATGFIALEGPIAGKWLELLKEIAPRVTRVAFLFNPETAPYAEYFLTPFKAAAASFAVEGIEAPVHDSSEIEPVVAAHGRKPNGGLIVMPTAFATIHRVQITSVAARYRLPAVYPFRFFTELGGLLSYGNDLSTIFGAPLHTSIASSRAQSRASFPSKAPSSSSS
jgi:putative ABC transport system substrate-binding protein